MVRSIKKGVQTVACQYDSMGAFSKDGLALICQNDLYGYVDRTGTVIVKPKYENARDFGDNKMAAVFRATRWCYINTNGKEVLKPTYVKAWNFVGGRALFQKNKSLAILEQTLNMRSIPIMKRQESFLKMDLP